MKACLRYSRFRRGGESPNVPALCARARQRDEANLRSIGRYCERESSCKECAHSDAARQSDARFGREERSIRHQCDRVVFRNRREVVDPIARFAAQYVVEC